MPAWVEAGVSEYARRLPAQCRLKLREIAAGRRGKNADLERLIRAEGEALLAAVPAGSRTIALERTGKSVSTRDLAQALETQMARGEDLAFLIGGPEGLAPACLQSAAATWSLSALTLAHPLVRVVMAEQIYRAWSIVAGKPYHRGRGSESES